MIILLVGAGHSDPVSSWPEPNVVPGIPPVSPLVASKMWIAFTVALRPWQHTWADVRSGMLWLGQCLRQGCRRRFVDKRSAEPVGGHDKTSGHVLA